MNVKLCAGCGAEIFRIKVPFQRRSIPVNAEALWIKKDSTGTVFVCETGAFVVGFPVGDSYDNTDVVLAYKPHLPQCPQNGRAPRKPRNRAKHDLKNGYNYEKKTFNNDQAITNESNSAG